MENEIVTILDPRGKIYKGFPIRGKKSKYYSDSLMIRTKGGKVHIGKPITTKIGNLKGIKKS